MCCELVRGWLGNEKHTLHWSSGWIHGSLVYRKTGPYEHTAQPDVLTPLGQSSGSTSIIVYLARNADTDTPCITWIPSPQRKVPAWCCRCGVRLTVTLETTANSNCQSRAAGNGLVLDVDLGSDPRHSHLVCLCPPWCFQPAPTSQTQGMNELSASRSF